MLATTASSRSTSIISSMGIITVGARAHGALSVGDDDLLAMPVPLPPHAVTRPEQQKIADRPGLRLRMAYFSALQNEELAAQELEHLTTNRSNA